MEFEQRVHLAEDGMVDHPLYGGRDVRTETKVDDLHDGPLCMNVWRDALMTIFAFPKARRRTLCENKKHLTRLFTATKRITSPNRLFFHLFYFHLFRGFGFRLVVFQPLPCESPFFRSRPQEYCPSAILFKPIIHLNNMSFFHHRKRSKSMMRIRTFRIAKKHTPLCLPNTAILQRIKGLKPSICVFLHQIVIP